MPHSGKRITKAGEIQYSKCYLAIKCETRSEPITRYQMQQQLRLRVNNYMQNPGTGKHIKKCTPEYAWRVAVSLYPSLSQRNN